MAHSNVKFGTLTGSEAGLTNAVNNALADAGMAIDDIDAVFDPILDFLDSSISSYLRLEPNQEEKD